MQQEWFETWFDSPYYPILYRNRNRLEAKAFIDHLLGVLELPPGSRVLDLACGQGRFSRYLAEKGFEVTGIDLSERSIEYAKAFESDHLSFFRHDMREPFRNNYFDCIFNFFTSFGYFKTPEEDEKIVKNVARGLKPNGLFVLDFFNSAYIRQHLKPSSQKSVDGIRFYIERSIEDNHVRKKIRFKAHGTEYFFEEKVRLFTFKELKQLFEQADLELFHTFGDYELSAFEEDASPRLIMIGQSVKKN